ncbi:carboxypeptidase-like regulatory domain-containing protein [bacterium]|nr:carboxypeptidase-like regulatory domain-containing protein [bacterium]
MKKILALLLIVSMVFAVGCLTSDSSKNDDEVDNGGGTGGSLKAENYIPLVKNATWKWQSTDESGYSYTYTDVLTGTTTRDGKTYWVMNEDSSDNLFRLSNNIMYSYAEGEYLEKAHAQQFNLGSTEIPLYNFNKSVGQTWTIFSDTMSEEGYSATINWTGKYIGLKDVTVPSGTFKNCAVFESTMKTEYTSEWGKGSYDEISTTYFAQGIGPVKTIDKYTDYEDGKLSYDYTSTDEVIYYNIPGGPSGGDNTGGGGSGTYNVSGYITDSTGKPLQNVLVSITVSGEKLETYTDSDGEYLIIEVPNGTYTLTPSKSGYTFTPAYITVTVNGDDFSATTAIVGKTESGGGGGTTGGTYFPTTKDATWNWKSVIKNADGDLLYDDTYHVTMSISSPFDGKDFVLMDISNDWNDPFVRYETSENVVYFHYDDDSYIWFKAAANAADEGGTFPFYKFGVSAQASWDVFSYQYDENTLITCKGTYLGKEAVTVAAGTFSDCAKILLTFTKTEKHYSLITNSYITETTVLASQRWFAAGVGMIKKESTRTIDMVVSDITVDEVTGYTIP